MTNQVIPEAAVEAAISAMLRTTPNLYRLSADVLARAALEAAAPHMLAEAWDEGFGSPSWDSNPYRG